MITWEKYTDENGVESIQKIDENGTIWHVPADATNSDYQAYLEHEAEAK